MAQRKGQTGNPFGRPKGARNKATLSLKKSIALICERRLKEIDLLFEELEPKDKASLYMALLKYVVPQAREEEEQTHVSVIEETIRKLEEAERN